MSTRAITTCCVTLALLAGVSGVVYAQEGETFQVAQVVTGSGDTDPPTVPANLSATAVSTSQIDLSWDASTDNVGVTGYQVFRNGLSIATATMTSYSDTGLIASTTYSYNVAAFDFALNISTTSLTVTATTLAESVVVDDDVDGGNGSRGFYIDIFNVEVVVEKQKATLFWETDEPARSRVSWGKTEDYETGQLSDVSGRTEHTAFLQGLSPGERYYARIEALDSSGVVHDTFAVTFITGAPLDTFPPGAVTNFQATGQEDTIDLSWINPPDPDFVEVRIIRSDKFFPEDIFGGKVVYEGPGTETVDTDVVQGVTYYYAAFARDGLGNYAAPAIARARLGEGVIDPFAEFPEAPTVPEGIDMLSLTDFVFSQEGNQISVIDKVVSVDGQKPLTAAVGYERLPKVLKTIGVTLTDPADSRKNFSFLLRIDERKEFYTATLAPLLQSGRYPLLITVLDFKNQRLKKIDGELLVVGEVSKKVQYLSVLGTSPLLLVLFLLAFLFLFVHQRGGVTIDNNTHDV